MSYFSRPARGEAGEYYFQYIDLVADGDICTTLAAQLADTVALLERVPADRVDFRYAPGKWTVREVLGHVNDSERLYSFRAFWFARGFESALPSFEVEVAFRHASAGSRPWDDHVEEFRAIRTSSLHLFRGLPPEAWIRSGTASDNPWTVRALAWQAAGHVAHHVAILRDRYF